MDLCEDSNARSVLIDKTGAALESLTLLVGIESVSATPNVSRADELVLNENICAIINGFIGKFLLNRNGGGPTDCKYALSDWVFCAVNMPAIAKKNPASFRDFEHLQTLGFFR